MKKIIILFLAAFLSLTLVSAFELQKSLVQLEQDADYPCYVQNGDTIVCPPVTSEKINEWKDKIDNFKDEEKNKGKLKDNEKKAWLDSRVVPYSKPNQEKQIDITKEYREKVDVYSLGDNQIKIGFATNVFGVSGTPLENFDVNTTTGMVRYRPLNMTWLNIAGTNKGLTYAVNPIININYSWSIWFNITSPQTTNNNFLFRISGDVHDLLVSKTTGNLEYHILNITTSYDHIISSPSPVNDSNWHNVISTFNWNSKNMSIYLDSVLVNSTLLSGTPAPTNNFLFIGNPSGFGFNGLVDEIRIYNLTLSQDDIIFIYNSGRYRNLSVPSSGLVSHMSLNEKAGTTAYDTSPKSYNASLVGTWQSDGINVTTLGYQVNISIVNITNALIFWENGTLIENKKTGNQTYTFLNNYTFYILDNFNVTETKSRTSSPIWFSSNTSVSKHIASNLSDGITTDIYITTNTCTIKGLKYTPEGGSEIDLKATNAYTCNNNIIYFSGLVNPASSSNDVEIEYYEYKSYNNNLCVTMVGSYSSFWQYFPTMMTLLAVLVIIGIIAIVIYSVSNPEWLQGVVENMEFNINTAVVISVIIILLVLAIFSVVSIAVIHSMCGV